LQPRERNETSGAYARKAPRIAFPNFFRLNPLKRLKTAKKKFGKAWRPGFGFVENKGIFEREFCGIDVFSRPARIFQIFAARPTIPTEGGLGPWPPGPSA
jgi:hypothetical protein